MLDDFKINISGNLDFSLPEMVKVKQKFESRGLPSISDEVYSQMDREEIKGLIKPGSKIAIGVGSRGVAKGEQRPRRQIPDQRPETRDPRSQTRSQAPDPKPQTRDSRA